jgi:hypothetical protein
VVKKGEKETVGERASVTTKRRRRPETKKEENIF